MASKVYFMSDRSQSIETSLVAKMLTLFDEAGFGEMIKPGDLVAIKLHCGEYNTTGYLRPVYARALADKVKSLGGRPFVCDTTTLPYVPYATRTNALDEYLTAERNGYNSGVLGCPFIVADGFLGSDDIRVDLPEGFLLKEAFIAMGIALADVLICLTHFKGHPMGTIGGTIKNLGIGCQSKRGKFNVHLGGHPKYGMNKAPVFKQLCKGKACLTWELCQSVCPYGLIKMDEESGRFVIKWDQEKCTGCLACLFINVPCGVVGLVEDTFEAQQAAMADGALGVLKAVGRDKVGFINMAIDISPWCDCVPFTDRPIVPNVGVFASKDAVAIDQACLDKAEESVGMPGSMAEVMGVAAPGTRGRFAAAAALAGASEQIQMNTGVKNGLGSKEYELIEVPPRLPFEFFMEWDPRIIGERLGKLLKREPVFPFDRGFNRLDDIDLSEVR